MKNLKLTVVMGALVAALSACGGGSSDDGGVDNSAMTLSVTPTGNQNMSANSSVKLSMNASVRRSSSTDTTAVTNMSWTIQGMNGEKINPVFSDPNCAGINISGASSGCVTTLSVPQNVTTGKWTVTGSASSRDSEDRIKIQRSESFTVTVDNSVYNVSAGNAQVVIAESGGIFSPVLLQGTLNGTNGSKIVSAKWTQISGPAVMISNPESLTASFIPAQVGAYNFRLEVVVDNLTITSNTEIVAQPSKN